MHQVRKLTSAQLRVLQAQPLRQRTATLAPTPTGQCPCSLARGGTSRCRSNRRRALHQSGFCEPQQCGQPYNLAVCLRCSEDSATLRRRAAEARLRDYGEEATSSGAVVAASNGVVGCMLYA
jgi:hypothetical protein